MLTFSGCKGKKDKANIGRKLDNFTAKIALVALPDFSIFEKQTVIKIIPLVFEKFTTL